MICKAQSVHNFMVSPAWHFMVFKLLSAPQLTSTELLMMESFDAEMLSISSHPLSISDDEMLSISSTLMMRG